jgi:hypothetical protein
MFEDFKTELDNLNPYENGNAIIEFDDTKTNEGEN